MPTVKRTSKSEPNFELPDTIQIRKNNKKKNTRGELQHQRHEKEDEKFTKFRNYILNQNEDKLPREPPPPIQIQYPTKGDSSTSVSSFQTPLTSFDTMVPRSLPASKVSEALKSGNKLRVVIYDIESPYHFVSKEDWQKLESILNKTILRNLKSSPKFVPPHIAISKVQAKGHRVIELNGTNSVKILNYCVTVFNDSSSSAKLEIVHQDVILLRQKGFVTINDMDLTLRDIQTLLQSQNSSIDCRDLICESFREGSTKCVRHVLLDLGKTAEESISRNKGRLKFGFDHVPVYYLKSNEANAY